MRLRLSAVLAGFALGACNGGDPELGDAQVLDAGIADAAVQLDAGPRADAGMGLDAGADAGLDASVETPPDAGPRTYLNCKVLLEAQPASPSGVYLIDPDGAGPLEELPLYCDMAFAGGGWTLILSNVSGRTLAAPGDAGSNASPDASYYFREPAPGALGALKAPHAQALALGAIDLHIRTPFADPANSGDAGYITSIAPGDGGPSFAIRNLRAGRVANANGDGGFAADWSGPNANLARLSFSNTGGFCSPLNTTPYPQIYWACLNQIGLHLGLTIVKWNFASPADEAMEVYVR
jgi:Fibrinogen beta and gamma chains, C-terminal globular domain